MKSNNYIKGRVGEDIAANYIMKNGFDILDRNYKIKFAEIDIIAYKNDVVHFIEVKSRTSRDFGFAYEAVDNKKQEKIRKTAEIYLNQSNFFYNEISFDIIEIYYDTKNINYIRGCF